MDYCHRICSSLLIALLLTIAAGPAWAQDEAAMKVPQPEDPGVAAILATNPTTLSERVRAAKILADLDRPDLAKGFLQKVLDELRGLDEAGQLKALVGLESRLGATVFTNMASREDLAPEARTLNHAVLTAVSRHLRDPARLAALIQQLQDPSPGARQEALAELGRSREAAVGPLIAVLADTDRAAEHPIVRQALVRLGSDAVGPLLAMLEAPDSKLVAAAIRALADLPPKQTTIFLLGPFASPTSAAEVRQAARAALEKLTGSIPSLEAAAELLAERAGAYLDRSAPLRADPDGNVAMWQWDAAAGQPVQKTFLADDASLLTAFRLARDAYSLAPEDDRIRLLYLATMLEQAAYVKGLDTPLEIAEGTPAGHVASFGPETAQALLVYGLESGHGPVASAAARILGHLGDAELALYQGPRPAPLVQATWCDDRRVRVAAVEAILQLQPTRPFPGSSRVTEALIYFAASGGAPRALVACPQTEEAQRVGGYLIALGYQVDTATNGRDAIRKLLASPDYELALVDAGLSRPTVDLLVQQLRHDCRAAKLPVGVLARSGQLGRAEHMVRRDPLAAAFSRPHTEEAVRWQVDQLLALLGRGRVLPAERRRHAAGALKWLAELSGQPRSVFDFSRVEQAAMTALYTPELGLDAIAVLGNLGTPESQQALVELASRSTQPIQVRTAAAKAFQQSTQHNRVLLTTDQILLQYDRYNQSGASDAATQEVLGWILDCIEAPARIEEHLKRGAPEDQNPETPDGNST